MKYCYSKFCPTCKQGRLFVMKKVNGGSLYLLCEECFCAFMSPTEATDGNNCQEGGDIEGTFASQEDIDNFGWSQFRFEDAP